MRIYLAGPMSNKLERNSLAEWRAEVIQACGGVATFLCPELVGCDHSGVNADMTVGDDIDLLRTADGVLAYLDSPERVGTCIEVGYALGAGIPVHLVVDEWVHIKPMDQVNHGCPCSSTCLGYGWPWFAEAAVQMDVHGTSAHGVLPRYECSDATHAEFWRTAVGRLLSRLQ